MMRKLWCKWFGHGKFRFEHKEAVNEYKGIITQMHTVICSRCGKSRDLIGTISTAEAVMRRDRAEAREARARNGQAAP